MVKVKSATLALLVIVIAISILPQISLPARAQSVTITIIYYPICGSPYYPENIVYGIDNSNPGSWAWAGSATDTTPFIKTLTLDLAPGVHYVYLASDAGVYYWNSCWYQSRKYAWGAVLVNGYLIGSLPLDRTYQHTGAWGYTYTKYGNVFAFELKEDGSIVPRLDMMYGTPQPEPSQFRWLSANTQLGNNLVGDVYLLGLPRYHPYVLTGNWGPTIPRYRLTLTDTNNVTYSIPDYMFSDNGGPLNCPATYTSNDIYGAGVCVSAYLVYDRVSAKTLSFEIVGSWGSWSYQPQALVVLNATQVTTTTTTTPSTTTTTIRGTGPTKTPLSDICLYVGFQDDPYGGYDVYYCRLKGAILANAFSYATIEYNRSASTRGIYAWIHLNNMVYEVVALGFKSASASGGWIFVITEAYYNATNPNDKTIFLSFSTDPSRNWYFEPYRAWVYYHPSAMVFRIETQGNYTYQSTTQLGHYAVDAFKGYQGYVEAFILGVDISNSYQYDLWPSIDAPLFSVTGKAGGAGGCPERLFEPPDIPVFGPLFDGLAIALARAYCVLQDIFRSLVPEPIQNVINTLSGAISTLVDAVGMVSPYLTSAFQLLSIVLPTMVITYFVATVAAGRPDIFIDSVINLAYTLFNIFRRIVTLFIPGKE